MRFDGPTIYDDHTASELQQMPSPLPAGTRVRILGSATPPEGHVLVCEYGGLGDWEVRVAVGKERVLVHDRDLLVLDPGVETPEERDERACRRRERELLAEVRIARRQHGDTPAVREMTAEWHKAAQSHQEAVARLLAAPGPEEAVATMHGPDDGE